MKGNDEDLSRINSCASLTVLTSSNFKLIIILQMLSFLIMIGASNVVSADGTPQKIGNATCPFEYKRQGDICVAERTSYAPKTSSICNSGGSYTGSGLCTKIKGGIHTYSVSCATFEIQDGSTCIRKCLPTHTMKNGKCYVKSSRLGKEVMTCPGRSWKQGLECYNGAHSYSLYLDCDHPSISNEWTKSIVIAELIGRKTEVLKRTTLDKAVLSKNNCTNKYLKNKLPIWSTETFLPAKYLGLTIKGGDGLYIDALNLQMDGKSKQWGKNGGKGWCMSTQRKDGGGSWKNFTGNDCYRRLLFNIETGKVKKLR